MKQSKLPTLITSTAHKRVPAAAHSVDLFQGELDGLDHRAELGAEESHLKQIEELLMSTQDTAPAPPQRDCAGSTDALNVPDTTSVPKRGV